MSGMDSAFGFAGSLFFGATSQDPNSLRAMTPEEQKAYEVRVADGMRPAVPTIAQMQAMQNTTRPYGPTMTLAEWDELRKRFPA